MPTREARLRREERLRAQARIQEKYFPGTPEPPVPPEPSPPAREDDSMARLPEAAHWVRFVVPGQGSFTYRGTNYDYGELIMLGSSPRDEQLVRLGYVYAIDTTEAHLHAECGVCERWFLTEYYRDMHGKRRHNQRFASDDDLDVAAGMAGPDGGAALRDITGDAEERRLMQENPLFLEKTKASQQG